MGGPPGGRIYEIARDPDDPDHLWAAGSTRELVVPSQHGPGTVYAVLFSHELRRSIVIRSDTRGGAENPAMFSIFVNSHAPDEVWISEGSPFKDWAPQPLIHVSTGGLADWNSVTVERYSFDNTQVRVIGAGGDGRPYVAAGPGTPGATASTCSSVPTGRGCFAGRC